MIIDSTAYMLLAGMSVRSGIRKSYLTHNSATEARAIWLLDHGYLIKDKDTGFIRITYRGRILHAKMRAVVEDIFGEDKTLDADGEAIAAFDALMCGQARGSVLSVAAVERQYRRGMAQRYVIRKMRGDKTLALDRTMPIPAASPAERLSPGSYEVRKYLDAQNKDNQMEK